MMARVHFLFILLMLLASGKTHGQESPRANNPHGPMDLDCSHCHSEGSWETSEDLGQFDHSQTGYPLRGRHQQVHCRECHLDPRFAFVGTSCADCHADIHNGRLGPDCSQCHTPAKWVDRNEQRIAHDATNFPLVGAHNMVDCDACHSDPAGADYIGTPADCAFCHTDDYDAATNPDHHASGFDLDCLACHSAFASTWGSGDFIHPPSFPLTGAHQSLDCNECHTDGFGVLPIDCIDCHQQDFDNTTDPDHLAAGMPTTCVVCHSTTAWQPAEFNHDTTGFPLTGAHRTTDCTSCHETGYTNTPSDCYACHQQDYENTTDPSHAISGFGTDCMACHGTNDWVPSTWDHESLFPIDSGPHREAWNSCTECHVVPNNYSVFECIFCHEHNRADTDEDHSEENDYEYLSPACLECHPDGRS